MTTAMIIGRLFVDDGDFVCFFPEAFFDLDFVLIFFLSEVFFGFLLIVILRYFFNVYALAPLAN